MVTADNPRFVRAWWEVSFEKIGFDHSDRESAKSSRRKWFPLQKGGDFRKWYGNLEAVVNWENDGYELLHMQEEGYPNGSTNHNLDFIFNEAIVWTKVTSATSSFRYSADGFLFHDASGLCALKAKDRAFYVLGLLNSCVSTYLLNMFNPTVNLNPGNIATIPLRTVDESVERLVESAVEVAKEDWNSHEIAWDFSRHALMCRTSSLVSESFEKWKESCSKRSGTLHEIEVKVNAAFIDAYGLREELSPEVPDDQITLYRPDRDEDTKRLLSYAIGCMMGRYSLDKAGLIYAHSGNQGFDPGQYKTFRADDDGIIPLLETDWGIRDDATNRIVEFIGVAWPKEHMEENLKFVADSLGPSGNQQPRDTIRRYLAIGFYKHHLSMYKRRPIHWLFSSGKQRAFQCLVYLHRYHEGTLARMRTEYVIPLQGKIAARVEQLEGDKAKATSTSHRNKLQKEQDNLKKQQAELHTFEEKFVRLQSKWDKPLARIRYNFERRFPHVQENQESLHVPGKGRHSSAPPPGTHPCLGSV